ncbi:hypothetical protein BCR32DRAFT_290573 [Anaeromyces robustus]|uniref:Uncharacterized protein n=1 Tax=Anaeromyces robustus TaxID=1754192 RepID=A0A1Y1XIK0_9FUNG|nr:hypothetical protein BCR32DRAFT_290573 [Anaeromyces robustus]|eukprot:ORX85589.1 hypothetical protein BCR32DRAFT_290573 [Anaeromyces robustus]
MVIISDSRSIMNIGKKRFEIFQSLMCHKSSSKDCLGGSFYKIHKKSAEKNAEFALNHGWNYVLLTTSVESDYSKNLLVKNTKAFREKDIDVHLMCLEDTKYIDNPILAYNEISEILEYVNEEDLDIQGIHIDCSPTSKKEWDEGSLEERNAIFNNYLRVIEYGRQAINELRPNTTYSGTVAWWISGDAKSGELEYGRGYDLVNKDRLDYIIVDSSGSTVEKVINKSEDFLADKVSTVIGISVDDYDYSEFNNIVKQIKKERKNNKYFKGISIFANHRYPDWDSVEEEEEEEETVEEDEEIIEKEDEESVEEEEEEEETVEEEEKETGENEEETGKEEEEIEQQQQQQLNGNVELPSICSTSSSKDCIGAWFYALHKKSADENAEYALAHGWNYVLISAQYSRKLLLKNIIAFRKRNIDVHVLCVENQTYLDDPTLAYDEIADILKFVNKNNLDIQGISIDCEPHAEKTWDNGTLEDRNILFDKYLEVIAQGRKAINDFKPNITYSGAVSAWYVTDAKNNELKHGRGYDLVNKDMFDIVIPMMYDGSGDTVEEVIEYSENYFTDKVTTIIGLSVKEWDYNEFSNIIEQVKNRKKGNKYFNGIAIFGNHLYPDWDSFKMEQPIEEEESDEEEEEEEEEKEVNQLSLCHTSSNEDCLGGWFYKIHKKSAEKNAEFALNHGWNYVLLTTSIESDYSKDLLVKNTKAFRENGIDVHLMCLEDTKYIDNPILAYNEISEILEYVNEVNLDIQGIHIDCSPTSKKEWDEGSLEEKNAILENYIKVIEYGRQAINELRPNTTYSATIAWWLSGEAKYGELEYGKGYDLVNKDRLDLIIPTIFNNSGSTIEKIIDCSEDFIEDKVSTVIGIAVDNYDYNQFQNVTQEIKNNRKKSKYFKGISVFANHLYPDWDD